MNPGMNWLHNQDGLDYVTKMLDSNIFTPIYNIHNWITQQYITSNREISIEIITNNNKN